MTDRHQRSWPIVLRHYLAISLALHLAWEIAQLPLFTISEEPWQKQAFAVFHCTLGDGMIAGLSLLLALAAVAAPTWPEQGLVKTWALMLILGVGYTIYSEWINVSVRGSWAYNSSMPRLPILGTGISPVLQWIVVPTLSLHLATRRSKRQDER